MSDWLTASDLVGCQYRRVQARRFPEIPAPASAAARADRLRAAREAVAEQLPQQGKKVRLKDLGPLPADDATQRAAATQRALSGAHTHITGGVLIAEGVAVNVDLLLRAPDGVVPVLVSNHRVARKKPGKTLPGVPTHRLGLSRPLPLPYQARHHVADGYRLAIAERALGDQYAGRAGIIGQDRQLTFFTETQRYQAALDTALARPLPQAPRRVKECASCRFWPICEPELAAVDDISLFLPGDKSDPYREQGIDSVQALIDADYYPASQLAAAWREGVTLLARDAPAIPRADVEVDVDMEAYLDQGAYLWGAWYAGEYHPFVTWEPLGGRAEAHNFAAFWDWLMGIRASAHAAGQTFAAYCYSAHGENHWMRMSAKRFGQPALAEVESFLSSPEWVDVFAHVKAHFLGPSGLGLKVVAPHAGFAWRQGDFAGEESVTARREALRGNTAVREALLTYNADDVRATRAVRDWMSAGAPGVRYLQKPPAAAPGSPDRQ